MFYPFIEVILFLLCIVICLYIPGRLLSIYLKLRLDGLESLFVSIVSGMVLFIACLYPLAWLHLEWLSLVIYGGGVFFAFRERRKLFVPIDRKLFPPCFFLIISAAVFSTTLVVWGQYGDRIFTTYDDIWHLTLIQEIQSNFPPDIPTYAGLHLTGYHFFSDFFLANVSKLFFITPLSLHFHLFPVLLSILWALGVFVFVSAWTKKTITALWAVFLTMFGGNFAYIFHWQGHPTVSLINGLGILQPANAVYNPPFTFSIVVLLLGLFLLYRYWQMKEKRYLVPFIFLLGLLPMIKVYAGMLLYGGFGILVLATLRKRQFYLLGIFALAGCISLVTYGVFVGKSGGLIWFPLWAPHDVLHTFSWYGYDEKIYTFTKEHVMKSLVEIETYGLILYIFGNLGTRLIGLVLLLLFLKKKHMPSAYTIMLCAMLFVALGLPIFFIQTGKVFEIKQMGMYYLFFCALFAAIGFSQFFSLQFRFQRIIKAFFFIIIILLTLPSSILAYTQIWSVTQQSVSLSNPYYRAMSFLKTQGNHNDTVLVIPSNVRAREQDISEWYKHSIPEVGAFSNKRLYLSFGVMEYPGMNSLGRIKELTEFLSQPSINAKEAFLKKYQIHYIFSPVKQPLLEKISGIKKIYDDQYVIYQFFPK